MAKNLRAKIPASDTLVICDVRKDITSKFVEETRAAGVADIPGAAPGNVLSVDVAANAREVAEKSVSVDVLCLVPIVCYIVLALRGKIRSVLRFTL